MTAKITAALHAIMTDVGYVQKTGKNAFHGYKYAGEADLLAVLRPAMIAHGLMLLPSVESVSPVDENGNVSVLVSYTLAHKDGDIWPEKLMAAGMGNDRAKNGTVGDKGVYKAITGANKYLLFKLFQIETGDDPEVVSAHDQISEEPAAPKQLVKTSREAEKQMREEVDACATVEELKTLWRSKMFQAEYEKLQPVYQQGIVALIDERTKDLIENPVHIPHRADIAPDFSKMEPVQ